MWISKKKLETKKRELAHEAYIEQLKLDAADRQWEDIEKLKKDVKKLKKIVKEGY
jgi:hypothetical protein